MDAGPGTDLGGLGWYLGIWVTMTAAMMLPSAAPMVLAYSSFSRSRRSGSFVAGYLAAWTLFGLAAYGVYRLVAGAGVRLAPLGARRALRRRRRPRSRRPLPAHAAQGGLPAPLPRAVRYLVRGWREGRLGALRMGAEHGLFCVGCCWGLMLALFALGVMSLFWTAVAAAVIFAEKVLPQDSG